MRRMRWMDEPHEFREDVYDMSMCLCGVPAMVHHLIEPSASDAAFPQVSGTIGGTSEGPRIAAETPLTTGATEEPR